MGGSFAAEGLLLPGVLSAVTVALWASAWLPEYLVALLFFATAMVLHAAPADVVFSGFLSAAFWLVLSGFVLGVAIRKVGLADRAAAYSQPDCPAPGQISWAVWSFSPMLWRSSCLPTWAGSPCSCLS